MLPRKRVHSLSVELLNAFVCICPGSRDLGENRITLKRRIPVHGLHPLVEAKRRVKVPGRRCAKSEFPHRYYKSREERSLCLVQELSLSLFSLSLLSCLPSDHLRALISADFYPRKTGGAQVLHSFSTAAGQAAGASNATVV